MAHSKQANKRIRTTEKARQRNKTTTSAMRTAVKKVARAKTAEEADANLATAMKKVDKAAKSGVIHKNAAARKKSRLQRAVNKAAAGAK
jgi:small subunit ribosomal protein S20